MNACFMSVCLILCWLLICNDGDPRLKARDDEKGDDGQDEGATELGAGNQPRAAPGPARPGAAGSQGQPAAASGEANPGPRKEKRPLLSQECEGRVGCRVQRESGSTRAMLYAHGRRKKNNVDSAKEFTHTFACKRTLPHVSRHVSAWRRPPHAVVMSSCVKHIFFRPSQRLPHAGRRQSAARGARAFPPRRGREQPGAADGSQRRRRPGAPQGEEAASKPGVRRPRGGSGKKAEAGARARPSATCRPEQVQASDGNCK